MIISQAGATQEEFRAILTSPFYVKKVSMNSYDAFKKPQATNETFSRGDLPGAKAVNTHRLQIKTYNVGAINLSKSSTGLVKDLIQKGYSSKNALDMQKAVRAYGLNAINTAGGVQTINNNMYEI